MFGLKTKSAVVFSVCLFIVALIGCDDDKKSRCCKCVCYQENGVTKELEEKEFTETGVTKSCDSACRYKCVDIEGMSLKNQEEVDCPSESADTQ